MKKIYSFIAAVIITASVFAQSPEKMSYQAVVRDAGNALVKNGTVGMQVSVLQGSASGTAVYVETQTPGTNDNGLFSMEIGDGTVVSGDFSMIDWTMGPYFLKTETDPAGGTNYSITGTSQMMSVPYALYAKTSGSSTPGPAGPAGVAGPAGPQGPTGLLPNGSAAGDTPYWDGTNWVTSSNNIYNDGGNVGIGRTNPATKLDVQGESSLDGIRFKRTSSQATGQTLFVGRFGGMVFVNFDTNCIDFSVTAILFIKPNGDLLIMNQASTDFNTPISVSNNVLTIANPCGTVTNYTFTSVSGNTVGINYVGSGSGSARWLLMGSGS